MGSESGTETDIDLVVFIPSNVAINFVFDRERRFHVQNINHG